ncbi:DUF2939 domain-containing protein [Phenylobacterium sp. J367]|uniref:DUF2939 domain-containing protein n=1 Tax=Phenylobacterium sp. J367 TaxID=2898435 RepID=UPI002150A44E|nr:DUF2939 domain-containing protein [Phenylobacterium sp. J367]MCR5878027.1 DUF2939 domain-containing protein [Phenylobacterium sp. J367]
MRLAVPRLAVLGLAALALTACATGQKLDAANDVHALLLSIRDNDQAAFDAHVDRQALKTEIQARLVAEGRKDERFGGLAAVLAPGLAELAGETLVQPRVFRLVAEHYGYTPQTKIPGPILISQSLKTLPDGRVCATREKQGACLLTFTKVDGTWKLTGFEGGLSELKI